MDPELLQALGIGAEPAPVDPLYGNLGTPGSTPTAGSPLDQAKVLARLSGQQQPETGNSALERMAGGFGSIGSLPKASSNKAGAFAQGLAGGLAGSLKGGAKTKDKNGSLRERMGILKQLFDMERSASRDASTEAYRNRSSAQRDRALDISAGRQSPERSGRDPLLREKDINDLVKDTPAFKQIEADDAFPNGHPRRMKPEARKVLEDELKAERERLRSLGAGAARSSRAPAEAPAQQSAPAATPATPAPVAPATSGPAPQREAPPPAANPKQDMILGHARNAIAAGKDPLAVREMLGQQGIDPSFLDQ